MSVTPLTMSTTRNSAGFVSSMMSSAAHYFPLLVCSTKAQHNEFSSRVRAIEHWTGGEHLRPSVIMADDSLLNAGAPCGVQFFGVECFGVFNCLNYLISPSICLPWVIERRAVTGYRFDISRYLASLRTRALGRCILYYTSVSSTQTIVQESFRGIQDGFACISDVQSAGKGCLCYSSRTVQLFECHPA
jgi:hypothetical protein